MDIKRNERGFRAGTFQDRYGNICSIQESSLATEPAIWLGVDENRMHLTIKQVEDLLPLLNRFVEAGDLQIEEPKTFEQITIRVDMNTVALASDEPMTELGKVLRNLAEYAEQNGLESWMELSDSNGSICGELQIQTIVED